MTSSTVSCGAFLCADRGWGTSTLPAWLLQTTSPRLARPSCTFTLTKAGMRHTTQPCLQPWQLSLAGLSASVASFAKMLLSQKRGITRCCYIWNKMEAESWMKWLNREWAFSDSQFVFFRVGYLCCEWWPTVMERVKAGQLVCAVCSFWQSVRDFSRCLRSTVIKDKHRTRGQHTTYKQTKSLHIRAFKILRTINIHRSKIILFESITIVIQYEDTHSVYWHLH